MLHHSVTQQRSLSKTGLKPSSMGAQANPAVPSHGEATQALLQTPTSSLSSLQILPTWTELFIVAQCKTNQVPQSP